MSNSVFVYPVVLLLVAYYLPALIEYYDLIDKLLTDSQGVDSF